MRRDGCNSCDADRRSDIIWRLNCTSLVKGKEKSVYRVGTHCEDNISNLNLQSLLDYYNIFLILANWRLSQLLSVSYKPFKGNRGIDLQGGHTFPKGKNKKRFKFTLSWLLKHSSNLSELEPESTTFGLTCDSNKHTPTGMNLQLPEINWYKMAADYMKVNVFFFWLINVLGVEQREISIKQDQT